MITNYFDQLLESYPDRAKYLEWFKYAIDGRVYYYGEQFKYPFESSSKRRIKSNVVSLYKRIHDINVSYKDAVITNAYFHLDKYLRESGLCVQNVPWSNGNMPKRILRFLHQTEFANFNYFISEEFITEAKNLESEVRNFLIRNNTHFVLLANDLVPIHRVFIDVAKSINIKTGIYLHGLPASYDSEDDSRCDYLFVWGSRIKDNYIEHGSNTKIIVTGHPDFVNSVPNIKSSINQKVLVLTRAMVGQPADSTYYNIPNRGILLQHIYAIETALKKIGVKRAVLRPHPSENYKWYAKFMDKDFYELDSNNLNDTLENTSFIVAPISTVIIDAVNRNIPYYPFLINKEGNYVEDIVPPFNDSTMPTSDTVEQLIDRLKAKEYVDKRYFEGYIDKKFDVNKIVDVIMNS